jgi:hypothetical protein
LFGREIIAQSGQAGTAVKIEISNVPSGIYFLQIKTGDHTVVKKIIVSH